MKTQKLKTLAEVRAWFSEQGLSVSEWCRQNGFSLSLTRNILDQGKPCHRGQSHQIAVMLGLKAGVITRAPGEALQRGPHTKRTEAATNNAAGTAA